MIVGVLTTCHTQYNSDSSICIFYITEQHSKFLLLTYRCSIYAQFVTLQTSTRYFSSFQTVCSMSAVMVSMSVLIRTFSSGILAGRGRNINLILDVTPQKEITWGCIWR